MESFHQKGFIALMSAIVISLLLLAITVSLGLNGYFGRLDILDSQSKEQSSALAQACLQSAMLEAANDIYSTNETVNVGSDTCTILSSQKNFPVAGQTEIKTQAVVNQAYTNLQEIINSSTFSAISFEECPTQNSCP